MTDRTQRVAYWIATGLFAALLMADGLGGIMQAEAGRAALEHLGYPLHLLTLLGIAKLLAAPAVLQTKFRTVKEWAFAGFVFSCFGAFWSRAAAGDAAELVFPGVFLAIAAVPYVLWKKVQRAGLVA